jgi:hypothetical protein
VSLGSCFERSGGLGGIAESGIGVANGILMCCWCNCGARYCVQGCLIRRVLESKGGFHMLSDQWRGSFDLTPFLTLMTTHHYGFEWRVSTNIRFARRSHCSDARGSFTSRGNSPSIEPIHFNDRIASRRHRLQSVDYHNIRDHHFRVTGVLRIGN